MMLRLRDAMSLPPLPPRAKRVAGRGRGWGVRRQIRCRKESENSRSHPPPPTPPRRFAEGGEQSVAAPPPTSRASFARLGPRRFAGGGEKRASTKLGAASTKLAAASA